MSFPCVNPGQIAVTADGVISPQHYMQWRHVATAFIAGTVLNPPRGGAALNIAISDITATWTNTTPISQVAYALVTRGGSQAVVQGKSRVAINMSHGVSVGAAPPAPALTLVSRFGTGIDTGFAAIVNQDFSIAEKRIGKRTALLGANTTVPAGQQFKARNELRLVSDAWDTLTIDGGTAEFESQFLIGDTQVDVFAYPVIP